MEQRETQPAACIQYHPGAAEPCPVHRTGIMIAASAPEFYKGLLFMQYYFDKSSRR